MDFSLYWFSIKKEEERNGGQNIKSQLRAGISLGRKYNMVQNIRPLKQAFVEC